MKNVIQICEGCAEKAGLRIPQGHCASFWGDTCDVCLEYKDVTDIHDFKKIIEEPRKADSLKADYLLDKSIEQIKN